MSDHIFVKKEEKTERGHDLVQWTCSCKTVSRWVKSLYAEQSHAQHVRGSS